jgi:hypothetical protein
MGEMLNIICVSTVALIVLLLQIRELLQGQFLYIIEQDLSNQYNVPIALLALNCHFLNT